MPVCGPAPRRPALTLRSPQRGAAHQARDTVIQAVQLHCVLAARRAVAPVVDRLHLALLVCCLLALLLLHRLLLLLTLLPLLPLRVGCARDAARRQHRPQLQLAARS